MSRVTVDKEVKIGAMRPMHAINNVPVAPYTENAVNFLRYYTEAGIPYTRFHDTGGAFGGNLFVDIPNIFRNFEADENDPASYDFTFTDWLIERVVKCGSKPFYRLGTSIENSAFVKAYHIYPPKDPEKWARICEHIIMHYNEGWADGFHYGIEYWEIWNEPDGSPDPNHILCMMWKGTKEEYFHLYEVTANHLKKRFPYIKIGGYASCGFYQIAQVAANPDANVSDRVAYFVEFFHDFMKFISSPEHKSPLDFFSWHTYSDVKENIIYANYVREQLDKYGYESTESICDEWNPGKPNRTLLKDAGRIAVNMLAWHKCKVDMAMYYDGKINSSYCGLFHPITNKPCKAFYAFKAFDAVYSLGEEVEALSDDSEVFLVAATDGLRIRVMLANNTGEDKEVTVCVKGGAAKTLYSVDEESDFGAKEISGKGEVKVILPADAVQVLEFEEEEK